MFQKIFIFCEILLIILPLTIIEISSLPVHSRFSVLSKKILAQQTIRNLLTDDHHLRIRSGSNIRWRDANRGIDVSIRRIVDGTAFYLSPYLQCGNDSLTMVPGADHFSKDRTGFRIIHELLLGHHVLKSEWLHRRCRKQKENDDTKSYIAYTGARDRLGRYIIGFNYREHALKVISSNNSLN